MFYFLDPFKVLFTKLKDFNLKFTINSGNYETLHQFQDPTRNEKIFGRFSNMKHPKKMKPQQSGSSEVVKSPKSIIIRDMFYPKKSMKKSNGRRLHRYVVK